MADRYWVLGTGSWNTTSTLRWSATSGGPAGASAPTSNDRVFFNGSSGGGTCTLTATVTCLSIDTTGYNGIIQFGTVNGLLCGSNAGVASTCVIASTTTLAGSGSSGYIQFGGNTGGNTLSFNPIISGSQLFQVRFNGSSINTAWTITSWGTAFGFPGVNITAVPGAFVHQFCDLTLNANVFCVSYSANNGSTVNRTRLNFNGFSIYLGRYGGTATNTILFSSLTTAGMRQMVGNGGFIFDGTANTALKNIQWNSADEPPNFSVQPSSFVTTPITVVGTSYFRALTFTSNYGGTVTASTQCYAQTTTLSPNGTYTGARMGMSCNNNQAGDMTFTSNGRTVSIFDGNAQARTTGTAVFRILDALSSQDAVSFISNTAVPCSVIFSNSLTTINNGTGLTCNSSGTTTWTFSGSHAVNIRGTFTISNGTQTVATNPSVWNFTNAGSTVGFTLDNNTFNIGNVTYNGGGGQIQFSTAKTYPTFTLSVASLTMNTPTGVGGNPTINIPNNVGISFGSLTLNTSSTNTTTFGGGGIGPKYITSPTSLNVTNCSFQGIRIVGGRWNAYNSNNNVDLGYNENVIFPNPNTSFGPFFNPP